MDIVVDMWAGEDEGALSKWFFDDGAQISSGDMIATVTMEKTEFEVHAPASGTLHRLVTEEGAVKSGDVIARIAT